MQNNKIYNKYINILWKITYILASIDIIAVLLSVLYLYLPFSFWSLISRNTRLYILFLISLFSIPICLCMWLCNILTKKNNYFCVIALFTVNAITILYYIYTRIENWRNISYIFSAILLFILPIAIYSVFSPLIKGSKKTPVITNIFTLVLPVIFVITVITAFQSDNRMQFMLLFTAPILSLSASVICLLNKRYNMYSNNTIIQLFMSLLVICIVIGYMKIYHLESIIICILLAITCISFIIDTTKNIKKATVK